MARPRKKKPDAKARIAASRGVVADDSGNSWFSNLVQVPGRSGPVDLDAIVDRLVERGVVGEARRDVADALHAGRVALPAGPWALLVALPGQSWAYLLTSGGDDYDVAPELARRSGLRTLGVGYQDTAGATTFLCHEGDEVVVAFESCGDMGGGTDEEGGDVEESGDTLGETRFVGARLPAGWFDRFEDEIEAQDALTREFDAFVPFLGASCSDDVVGVDGFDDVGVFGPDDFLRVDLLGFGDARLEPPPASRQLRDALAAGDVEATRAAVAAGADLRAVPGSDLPPLVAALRRRPGRGEASRRDLVGAILELGADPNPAGSEPPVHVVLDQFIADEGELIGLLGLLIERGADVNARGVGGMSRGRTPLHVASSKGWMAASKFLLAKGAGPRAVDGRGMTPARAIEASLTRFRELATAESDARARAMIALLSDAEAGRADLDWAADAEDSGRRERKRRREMKVGFGNLGAGIKAFGGLMEDGPSVENVARMVVFSQPDEIHLTPDETPWDTEDERAETAAVLASEGYEPIGRFAIPELPNILVDAHYHPVEHAYAAIYDAAGQSILDLIRRGRDGLKLTVTNNTSMPASHFEMPDRVTIRLPGTPADDLVRAFRSEPIPPEGIEPVTADEFVGRFESSWRSEMKARKRRLRQP